MGQLIKKGIPYSGSSNSAKNIKFDNKNSELTSGNVQTAIDELSEKVDDLIDDSAVSTESTWSATKIQNTIANISVSGGGSGTGSALTTTYDNSTSGLSSTSVQGAIDEVDTNLDILVKSFNEHEHTAEEVGALPITGGTITGSLKIDGGITQITYGSLGSLIQNFNDPTDLSNFSYFAINHNIDVDKTLRLVRKVDGTNTIYNVYGEHNKPTASDVGAVPITRKINNKALSADITLDAINVGAVKNSEILTTSILEKALTLSSGVYFYAFGSGYNGNDLPSSDYMYGCASVHYRSNNSIVVQLYGLTVTTPRVTNWYDGSKWRGWTTEFLPLTGGTVSGNTTIQANIPTLHLKVNDNLLSTIMKNANESVDYGTKIIDKEAGGKTVGLVLSAKNNLIAFSTASEGDKVLYGEHNITSGTTQLTSKSSALASNAIYQQYE